MRLADRTATQVETLWGRHRSGELTISQFRSLASAVVARANSEGVHLVDLGLAAYIIRQLGRPTAPLGLTPAAVQIDQSRIAAALARILAADIDTAETAEEVAESRRARVSRFARDEALLTVSATTTLALQKRQLGWVRRTDPNPCVLCQGWADGKVRSANVAMRRHRGCACIAQPVFS